MIRMKSEMEDDASPKEFVILTIDVIVD